MKRVRSAASAAALSMTFAFPLAAQEIANELYGNFRYSFNGARIGGATDWSAVNNASRLGVRGSVRLDGLEAFYQIEAGVAVDGEGAGAAFTQRFYLAGVRGAFGSLTVGRLSPEYKMAGLRIDPFYDTSSPSATAGVPSTGSFAGATFGLSRLTNGWADRTIAYATPSHGGLTGMLALNVHPDDDPDLGVGVRYRESRVDAGVQYRRHDSDGRNWGTTGGVNDALRAHARYEAEGLWSVGLSVERLDPLIGARQNLLYLSATVRPRERALLAASVGAVGSGDAGHPEGTGVNLQAAYDLLPRQRLYLIVSSAGLDGAARRTLVSAGMSLDFSIGG